MKVKGFDVVATWKVLVALHVIPIQYLIYSLALWYSVGLRWIGLGIFLCLCSVLFGLFVWLAPDVTSIFSQLMFRWSVLWYRVDLLKVVDEFEGLVEETNQVFKQLEIVEPENPTEYNFNSFFDYDS